MLFFQGDAALNRQKTEGAQSFPELFRRSGYYTVGIGKISHHPDGKVFSYDGISLVPVLKNEAHQIREGALTFWENTVSVRSQNYRLISNWDGETWTDTELYDMNGGPDTSVNLVDELSGTTTLTHHNQKLCKTGYWFGSLYCIDPETFPVTTVDCLLHTFDLGQKHRFHELTHINPVVQLYTELHLEMYVHRLSRFILRQ